MRLPDKYVQLRSAGALPVYTEQLHFSARRLWPVQMRIDARERVRVRWSTTDGLVTLERVTCEEVLHPRETEDKPEVCVWSQPVKF